MRPNLAHDSLETRLSGGVDEAHGGGDAGVESRDAFVHGLGDGPVSGVTLAA